MRIVIDMQGAQTESRFRGIGRYALSFAKAVLRNRGEHEVIIVLSGLFPETIEPIRAAFDGLLPQENIRVLNAPGPVRECEPDNDARRETAELIREAFFASLQPDVIHICSLFEGYVDDAVTSIGRFDTSTPVSVTLYDLIPLLNPDHYLTPNQRYAQYYQRKVGSLKQAASFLAISEFSRQEGLSALGVPETQVINVSTAIEPHFSPLTIDNATASQLREKFGITRPFVLYTGGSDERKNLPCLIQAFAALPTSLRENHQLLFAGKMPESDIARFREVAKTAGLQSDELLFTGYITEEELVQLYNLCRLYIFPSWHEGFGLPALEAMACGAPVISANTTSLPEVIGLEEALFDPLDVGSIAAKMQLALTDETFRTRLIDHGLQQAKRFYWDETANRAIAAWDQVFSERIAKKAATRQPMREEAKEDYSKLVEEIASVLAYRAYHDEDLCHIAQCLADNERQGNLLVKSTQLPEKIVWRIEGPFDSSYSLALVNRETARALSNLGHTVILHSTEGPGDFPANPQFLAENPDLAEMYHRANSIPQDTADVTSRNLYPPRVADMKCRFNFLHAYGWEESGFPQTWVENFNLSLQGMTVMSEHVRKIMIDNGVTVPIAVSGIGVDHWERIISDNSVRIHAKSFRFLHVSSCFPRKGADRMLEAYGRAFTSHDDVTLVIKTFQNPHNEIHRWLEDARARKPDFPDVLILDGDYSDAKLKSLYQQCHVLVAPSLAEGFGLPLAEAMLSGLAVITTGWSGQLDFCKPNNSWLVDYQLERAKTHFNLFHSVWAAPNVEDLARVMRQVYEAPESDRKSRAYAGRMLLLQNYRWSHVAERMVAAARAWSIVKERREPRIGWITTWNTRCGIATYSEHLIPNMSGNLTVFASHAHGLTKKDGEGVIRCWSAGESDSLDVLNASIEVACVDVLVIQFNYGFFHLETFANFLNAQISAGRVVVVTPHSTTDPAHVPHKKLIKLVPALTRCHRVLVHSPNDMNRLKTIGLVDNVILFPHGILDFEPPRTIAPQPEKPFVLASYGFFLPHKGLLELIDAVALIRRKGMDVELRLINAEYPIPESKQLIEQATRFINSMGLSDYVTISSEYLEDQHSLTRLAEADLIVFPYQTTSESASGAVRYGFASGKPVAVTPLSIFDDLGEAVFRLPGTSPEQIASGLEYLIGELKSNSEYVRRTKEFAENFRESCRYSVVGSRLRNMLLALWWDHLASHFE